MRCPLTLKLAPRRADSHDMMISEEQACIAAHCVGVSNGSRYTSRPDVSPELMIRIMQVIEAAPDPRYDRVAEARERLALGIPGPYQIAEKILARAVSDAIR